LIISHTWVIHPLKSHAVSTTFFKIYKINNEEKVFIYEENTSRQTTDCFIKFMMFELKAIPYGSDPAFGATHFEQKFGSTPRTFGEAQRAGVSFYIKCDSTVNKNVFSWQNKVCFYHQILGEGWPDGSHLCQGRQRVNFQAFQRNDVL